MQETELVKNGEEFQQGDIIKIFSSSKDLLAPKYGVIINADCDIANDKTDCMFAYLPLYPFETYLEIFWIPKYLNDEREALQKSIKSSLSLTETEFRELESWLSESIDTNEVLESLKNEYGQKKDKFWNDLRTKLTQIKHLQNRKQSSLRVFSEYCALTDKPVSYVRRQLQSARKNIGDNNFLISELVGLKEIGFVIRMARIYALRIENCFTCYSQLMVGADADVRAHRIARLTPLYRFKVSQLFAQQYSRIGLPDETMKLSDLALDDIASRVVGAS